MRFVFCRSRHRSKAFSFAWTGHDGNKTGTACHIASWTVRLSFSPSTYLVRQCYRPFAVLLVRRFVFERVATVFSNGAANPFVVTRRPSNDCCLIDKAYEESAHADYTYVRLVCPCVSLCHDQAFREKCKPPTSHRTKNDACGSGLDQPVPFCKRQADVPANFSEKEQATTPRSSRGRVLLASNSMLAKINTITDHRGHQLVLHVDTVKPL